MITALSNARTVSIPEHMAGIYHAALGVALAALEQAQHGPEDQSLAIAARGVLLELQTGFAAVPEGATAEPSIPAPVQVRPRAPEMTAAERAALAPLAERIRLVLGSLYTLEPSDCGWWICDPADGEGIMGPHLTPEEALDAWADRESRPAE